MADDKVTSDFEEYEEPSLVDLEQVSGGAADAGGCWTGGSGSSCDGCYTGGSTSIEEQA